MQSKMLSLSLSIILLCLTPIAQIGESNTRAHLLAHNYVEILESPENPRGLCLEACLDIDDFNQEFSGELRAAKSFVKGLEMMVVSQIIPGTDFPVDSLVSIRAVMPPFGIAGLDSVQIQHHYELMFRALQETLQYPMFVGRKPVDATLVMVARFDTNWTGNNDLIHLHASERDPIPDLRELFQRIEFPEECRQNGVEGHVMVRGLLNEEGEFDEYVYQWEKSYLLAADDYDEDETREYLEEFFEATEDAMDGAAFVVPALWNCEPIKCWISIPVFFKLE